MIPGWILTHGYQWFPEMPLYNYNNEYYLVYTKIKLADFPHASNKFKCYSWAL